MLAQQIEFSPFGQQSMCECGVSAPVMSVQLCGTINDLEKPGCGFTLSFLPEAFCLMEYEPWFWE